VWISRVKHCHRLGYEYGAETVAQHRNLREEISARKTASRVTVCVCLVPARVSLPFYDWLCAHCSERPGVVCAACWWTCCDRNNNHRTKSRVWRTSAICGGYAAANRYRNVPARLTVSSTHQSHDTDTTLHNLIFCFWCGLLF